jgi:hypothetical protein
MTNRIPNDLGATPPPEEDTTARVVGKILRAKPKVEIGRVDGQGMVVFTLFYRSLRIKPEEIRRMSLLRRSLLADFLGRFLILTNLDDFLPLLTECDYTGWVRRFPHIQIGLGFDDVQMIFRFNIALLYPLINESLAKMLEGERAWVKWSWDFFRRVPQNPAH